MREVLAERLLAEVMKWNAEDVSQERPLLQAMAALKYDEYQQFSPGMRFVESLALWVSQFSSLEERRVAYEFVKSKLIFFSSAEMTHFVSTCYADYIRPLLLSSAAYEVGVPEHHVATISNSAQFKELRRRSLFLGLSDGARIDIFRRSSPELSHEQIHATYEVSKEKADSMKSELIKSLKHDNPDNDISSRAYFRTIFLLDDFSGSGVSYLHWNDDSQRFTGKIAKFYYRLCDRESALSGLIDVKDLHICVVLYVASEKSRIQLEQQLPRLLSGTQIAWDIRIVQPLSGDVAVDDDDVIRLTDAYYDPTVEDEHIRKGGSDVRCGFANCALPLVLCHNTPNNSLFLLWANPEECHVRGLFPRVSRHRSDV